MRETSRCGPADPEATFIDDPVLVVEVESPSTKRYDMHDKRRAYQSLPGLRHLLFISPRQCLIELVTRQEDERWLSSLMRDPGAVLTLEALGIELPVAELYADTDVIARPTR